MTDQPATPAPAAAAPEPAPAPTAPATDPAAEVARLQADLDKWKGHAREWETRAKANADAARQQADRDAQLAKVAQALGLEGAKPDPEAIARQLEAEKQARTATARELAVLRAAQATGADGDALLDSRAFLARLDGIDPTDMAAVRAAVAEAVAANPKYAAHAAHAAAPPRQASTASDFNAAPGGQRQWTADDVRRATPAQVQKAMAAGLLNSYMAS